MTDEIRLLRLPEVRHLTGLSRTRIYELEARAVSQGDANCRSAPVPGDSDEIQDFY